MVLRWRGAKNIGIYGVFSFRECDQSPKHRLFGAFWGFAKTVDLTILRGLQKEPATKITTTTTTGPSSNSYNNNNNNNNDDDADDDADDDQDNDNNDNNDNDDNDDKDDKDDKDDNKDNDNDNTNKNKNENEKEDQKQQQQRRQRRCSSQHVMSASSDEIPLSLSLLRPIQASPVCEALQYMYIHKYMHTH